jgi:hypothetical protein
MLGLRGAERLEFFAGSLRDLIPDEHVLARVDRLLDLLWPRTEVADLYCADDGRDTTNRPGLIRNARVQVVYFCCCPGKGRRFGS